MSTPQERSFVYSNTSAQSVLRPVSVKGSSVVNFRLNCYVICNKDTGEVFCVTDVLKKTAKPPQKDAEVKLSARKCDVIVVEFPGGKNPNLEQIIEELPPEPRKRVKSGIGRWYSSKPTPDNILPQNGL